MSDYLRERTILECESVLFMRENYFKALRVKLGALQAHVVPLLLLFLFGYASISSAQPQRLIDSLTAQLKQDTYGVTKLDLYWSLAEAYWQANPDSALVYSKKLFHYALELRDTTYMMHALRSMAISHDYAYRIDSAKIYYDSVYRYALLVNDSLQIGHYNFNMGTLMVAAGDYVKALPYYENAIAVYSKLPDSEFRVAVIYTNLAFVYRTSRRYRDAVTASKKALALSRKQPQALRDADFNAGLGDAYLALHEFDSAKVCFMRVMDYAEKEKDFFYKCAASNGLGIIAFHNNELKRAKNYFTVVRTSDQITDPSLLITTHSYLGAIASLEENVVLANEYFNKALTFVDEISMASYTLILYELLASHYERIGNFQKALLYHQQYAKLNNQFVTKEIIDRTAEWENRYRTQEKELELTDLKLVQQQTELIARKRSNERNIFIFSSAILALLFGSGVFFYRNRRREALILEEKNKVINSTLKEKELLMKEIHHRVKNNLQVVSSLLNLQTYFVEDSKASAAILDSKNRVHAMSLIHQSLYQQDDITEVNIHDYIQQLLYNLEEGYDHPDKAIEIVFEADKLPIDVDLAIPIGLIVNELVTNSFKHAFLNCNEGEIFISFKRQADSYTLLIRDNGAGVAPQGLSKPKSLGMKLLADLSKKLKATTTINSIGGYETKLNIPIKLTV
jgi:two-component sensor histidine kinase